MKKKHTPGPWDFERDWEDGFNPVRGHYTSMLNSVAIIYGDGDEDYWRIEDISDADARLIAAAPKLLEVCEQVLKMQSAMLEESEMMPKSFEAPKSVTEIGKAVEWARRAIKEAKG